MGENDIQYDPDSAPDEANCYSDRQKLYCKKFITGIGALAIIVGLIFCTYGYLSIRGTTLDPATDYVTEFKIDANAAIAGASLVCGVLAILVGLLGLAAARFMNPLVTVPFGALSFIIAIFAFVCAGAVLAGPETTLSFYKDICLTDFESFGGQTGVDYMKAQYGLLVDDKMCDADCVCEETAFQSGITPLSASRLGDYGTNGRETEATPDSGRILLQSAATGYTKYEDCFTEKIKPAGDANAASDEWNQFVNLGGYDFMSQMEDDWDCASICYEPLFYLSKSID